MAKRKGKSKSVGTLVVTARVKEYIRSKDFRTGGDFIDALSDEVEIILDNAMDRADTNGRTTLRAGDL